MAINIENNIEKSGKVNPKISIVMSTYNESEKELKEAIDSMLNQTMGDFEFIIVIDNPNNDRHKEILSNYEKKDERIKILCNDSNIGLAKSLNIGIDFAKGKYIARMDADDISEPNRLEKELDFLENNTDIDILSTNKIDIDEFGNVVNIASSLPTNDKKIKRILKVTSVITHSAAVFKKEKIEKIGKYRPFFASQDYDLWLRASYYGLKFAIIDEPLIKYRVRQNNISNTNPLKQYLLKEYIQVLNDKREKYGEDDFSIENMNEYLLNNKAFDEKEIEQFKKGMNYLNLFKKYFKEKKMIKAIINIIKSLKTHKKMKNVLMDFVKSSLLKKRG